MARLNLEKQKAVLLKAQESRKEQTQQKVLEAVQRLQAEGKTITFPDIAKVAGVSVSYLYKWDNIKDYIQSLRDESNQQLHDIPSKNEDPRPYGLKTLHETARKRIQELEIGMKELKRQNELYRGHVAEIYELREENERLRTQLRELTSPKTTGKVVPLQPISTPSSVSVGDISTDITQMIQAMGIKLGIRLQREIKQHTSERVISAIKAFQQYRGKTVVENPGACLLTMIRDEAEPSVSQKPISPQEDEFDSWYAEAVRNGFCIDIPKNLLGDQEGEVLVKIRAEGTPGGYQPMKWREAQSRMKQ